MLDRISLLLINLALVAFLLLMLIFPAHAQPNSVGASAYLSTGSQESGNTKALGICAEVTHDIGTGYAILTGEGCLDNGAKGYVGDGHNLRARGEVHGYLSDDVARIRPYVVGGVNWAQQSNSQYSKAITNIYVGGGINFHNRFWAQGEYLLPEHGTQNSVSAIRASAYYLHPLSPHWSAKLGAELTSTRFYQPSGPLIGWHRANSIVVKGGILRVNNPQPMRALAEMIPLTAETKPGIFIQSYLYFQESGQQIPVNKSWSILLPDKWKMFH